MTKKHTVQKASVYIIMFMHWDADPNVGSFVSAL